MTKKLCGWGKYPHVESTILNYRNIKELSLLVTNKEELIAQGNGRSYGDSALSKNCIDVRPHDYFIDFNEKTGLLHVQAGVILAEILEHFVPRGWFLKVVPGTKLITIGGAIASDVHGKNHHNAGCFSTCIKEFNIILATGEKKLCSKIKSPVLFKASCGGQGLTGIITDVQIYLKRIPSNRVDQTTIKTNNLNETFRAFEEYKNEQYSVAWIDCLAKDEQRGKGLLMVGDFSKNISSGKITYKPQSKLNIPFNFPNFCLNKWTVKAFNKLYHWRHKDGVSHQKVTIDEFFFPLDGIKNWNNIYGSKGFLQYQLILPKKNSYNGLEQILKIIAASGKGSFLAVLKLYGASNDNYLSFPMEGYSLALDFKIDNDIFNLLDELDKVVIKNEGRIYLAKDARVSKEVFEQGYPNIDKFREYRKKQGMDKKFNSLQSKRIGL
ncbi:MAG: FAD-binding oxidoreductase [Alcanivoracaceae bacterium]|nr:FAD-binding oxidoreductase [Alcanivoracaceae bacterium]